LAVYRGIGQVLAGLQKPENCLISLVRIGKGPSISDFLPTIKYMRLYVIGA
jgi:hypothetical protein